MRSTPITHRRAGFTLVELLVVIGIIAVLAGVALTLGARVRDGGKARLTEQVINVLDTVRSADVTTNGPIPSVVADPRDADRFLPLADARNMTSTLDADEQVAINTGGLFVAHVESRGTSGESLESLDARVFQLVDVDGDNDGDAGSQPALRTPLDAWGRPIRLVHPAFDRPHLGDRSIALDEAAPSPTRLSAGRDRFGLPAGATLWIDDVRRAPAAGDADGGACVGGTPYFYSAGPDGDPSTTDDNVYTTEPVLPASAS